MTTVRKNKLRFPVYRASYTIIFFVFNSGGNVIHYPTPASLNPHPNKAKKLDNMKESKIEC